MNGFETLKATFLSVGIEFEIREVDFMEEPTMTQEKMPTAKLAVALIDGDADFYFDGDGTYLGSMTDVYGDGYEYQFFEPKKNERISL